jgi:phenylpyruvate tautomerase PptA (4-oxalocrotonate tautomerase family)
MPILDIEIVVDADEDCEDTLASQLADAAGEVFGTESGRTWIRLHLLPRSQYAENGGGPPSDVKPVFVQVLKAELPDGEHRRREALNLAQRIADVLQRPVDNVHVLYEPPAAGRIAFGGQLLDE